MRKRIRLSFEQRQKRLEKYNAFLALEKRKRRLFNFKFRKSSLYISSWLIRGVFVLMFIAAVASYYIEGNFSKEVVSSTEVVTSETWVKTRRIIRTIVYFSTDVDSYSSEVFDFGRPNINPGDTVLIERNFFGKAIHVTKRHWDIKHWITINIIPYFLIFLCTLASFGFNDGLDSWTDAILTIFMVLDVVSVLCYLFTG